MFLFAAGFGAALLWNRGSRPAEVVASPKAPSRAGKGRATGPGSHARATEGANGERDGKPSAPDGSNGFEAIGTEPEPAPPPTGRNSRASTEEGIVLSREAVPGARLAIVIDDLGNDPAAAARVAALAGPIAGAVLPALGRSRETALALARAGKEVLLHLPMEPIDSRADPGPGVVRVAMSRREIAALVTADLEDVPGADGVNNHMGSKASASRATMDAILGIVKDRGLYFLDSRTTAFTVAAEEAARLGVPCRSRSIFLDDVADEKAIGAQLDAAVEEARTQGAAIAIGHPHSATLGVLERELSRWSARGVSLSRVGDLMSRGTSAARRSP